jgi:hypothetical protein
MSRKDLPSHHPFFGKEIYPDKEKKEIEKILFKYRSESVSEDLKKRIYDDLTIAKEKGIINIPFKVVLRKSKFSRRSYIEILLETKV